MSGQRVICSARFLHSHAAVEYFFVRFSAEVVEIGKI